MKWKRWPIGLLTAILSGALSGLVGAALDMTAKQIWWLIGLNAAKDGLLFLKQHPFESISFDTAQITRQETTITTEIKANNETKTP